jgi:hypothetical protein
MGREPAVLAEGPNALDGCTISVSLVSQQAREASLYLLVPREVSHDAATLWLASVDEPTTAARPELAPSAPGQIAAAPWQTWPTDGSRTRIVHREIRVTALRPRQTYSFALQVQGAPLKTATVTTLPAQLPAAGEKPFTVLLGSCFAHHEDRELKVGNAFFHMPHAASPDIKLLAGDQVYLDSPWYRYLLPHSLGELRDAFVEHYGRTWGQSEGFARVLTEGANYFSSDDHEFWNNAPNFVAFAANTWSAGGRRQWFAIARELYQAFQTSRSIDEFAVPPVSFLIADTRINRDAKRGDFMSAGDLDRVRNWIGSLTGPGVLVLGQPLLQTTTGALHGHFGDWNLPDFAQYRQLAGIVGASRNSIVILTGDVHYGRIAHARLRSGAELIEIISSPLSLVDEAARGEWTRAPTRFPAVGPAASTPAALAASQVETEGEFAPTGGHFLTLELSRRGPGARLRLRFWPVFRGGVPPADFGRLVWERHLM